MGSERKTDKQRERRSGKHGGVVTSLKRSERERNSCIESDYEREAEAKSGSPLRLTVTRWQRFAAQRLSQASTHLHHLLLTSRCLTIDPPGLCVFM